MYGHWMKFEGLKILNLVFASTGVNLFFVLSGFLITGILIKSKLADEQENCSHWYSIKQFFIRRTLRIFPLYYVVIFVTCLINFKPARGIFFWLITYTTNIYWSMGGALGAFGHLWSLAVEEQFYLFFPFFILFIPTRYILHSFYAIIIFAICTRLAAYIIHPDGVESYSLMPCCLDSFALGGILAYWLAFNRNKLLDILSKKWIWISSLLLFVICCVKLHLNPSGDIFVSAFYRFSISISCFWLIGRAALQNFNGIMKIFLENKTIIYLGRISYGLYVYHHFMPYLTSYLFHKFNLSLPFPTLRIYEYALLYFLLTLMFSVFSWHLLEKPFNSLKKYFEYKSGSVNYYPKIVS
jgi:peptidoglycan/LPS O-acetylase OafA/YrhL